jgi:shikimate kinase
MVREARNRTSSQWQIRRHPSKRTCGGFTADCVFQPRRVAGRLTKGYRPIHRPSHRGLVAIGAALAERLGARFSDLDEEFTARHGDISAYLAAHGYQAYAEQNVGLYLQLVGGPVRLDIVALSSGFMTYGDSIHPDYLALRQRVASSPSTFVLLPSVNVEACVSEIVRRQLRRPFARSAEREEQVIRERFFVYFGLSARKVETMQPVEVVVAELIAALAGQQPLHLTAPGALSRAIRARCVVTRACRR